MEKVDFTSSGTCLRHSPIANGSNPGPFVWGDRHPDVVAAPRGPFYFPGPR